MRKPLVLLRRPLGPPLLSALPRLAPLPNVLPRRGRPLPLLEGDNSRAEGGVSGAESPPPSSPASIKFFALLHIVEGRDCLGAGGGAVPNEGVAVVKVGDVVLSRRAVAGDAPPPFDPCPVSTSAKTCVVGSRARYGRHASSSSAIEAERARTLRSKMSSAKCAPMSPSASAASRATRRATWSQAKE